MRMTRRTRRTAVAVVLVCSIAVFGSTRALAAADQDAARTAIVAESDSTDPAWSRVRRLAPGTGVAVTLQGLPPRERHVLSVNESGLTVLNTASSRLPSDIQDVLREVAVSHPENLSGASLGHTVILQRSISLQRDGVFVDGRKLANLGGTYGFHAARRETEVIVYRASMAQSAR